LSRVKGMKILSAEIPFSYYVFTLNNNPFEVSTTASGPWISAAIPVGNYTKDTILPVLKSVIEAAIPGTITVTYNTTTLKLVFSSTACKFLTFYLPQVITEFNPR